MIRQYHKQPISWFQKRICDMHSLSLDICWLLQGSIFHGDIPAMSQYTFDLAPAEDMSMQFNIFPHKRWNILNIPYLFGYGSIPIDTIFSGLFTSINPSYDLGFTARYQGFDISCYTLLREDPLQPGAPSGMVSAAVLGPNKRTSRRNGSVSMAKRMLAIKSGQFCFLLN